MVKVWMDAMEFRKYKGGEVATAWSRKDIPHEILIELFIPVSHVVNLEESYIFDVAEVKFKVLKV